MPQIKMFELDQVNFDKSLACDYRQDVFFFNLKKISRATRLPVEKQHFNANHKKLTVFIRTEWR